MSYTVKNYTEQGGEVTHIGGKLIIDEGGSVEGLPFDKAENQASCTGNSNGEKAVNALLLKLKNAGLMVADTFTMQYAPVTDTVAGHTDRQYNTGKISGVAIDNDNHVITVTLSEKVEDLKDFDGAHGWGIHKWLGIGLGVGITLTDLYYNGSALDAGDISEATACSLGDGYFVRWVAADLVLAGDNTQKSVDSFTLWADGYAETTYRIVIAEPSEQGA